MSLQCAISGEPLTSDKAEEIVVTPSGHLCLKRLILTKLSENGGVDPFSDSGRPLSEDDLVSLQAPKQSKTNMPPPPSSTSSFTGTLQQLAKEYDSVVLELFDTRKALQDTRRELSQALYQNDAAIRVLARVSMERDAARQDAQQFQVAAAASQPQQAQVNGDNSSAPSKKKPRLDENADLPLTNDIPSSDLDVMLEEWEKLHKSRRSKPKSTYALPASWKVVNSKSWHKSTCRGLTALCQSSSKWLVTAGKDKQIMVYDSQAEVLGATFSPKMVVHSLDCMPKEGSDALLVAAACNQDLKVYDTSAPDAEQSANLGDTIVCVTGHPTGKHIFAVTKGGKLILFRIPAGDIAKMQQVSTFSGEEGAEYSCGAMHPDGLIFAVGSSTGAIKFWDLKSKEQSSTSFSPDKEDAAVAITFNSNGYQLATAHSSGAVRVWDMRKNKLLAEVNVTGDNLLKSVESLAFHPDAKHLAYGGKGGVHITTVKEWKVSAQLEVKGTATGLLWDPEWIVATSGSERAVTFHAGDK